MRLAQPLLSNSIFKTRLGLIRSRNNSCPLDALDFIQWHLERTPAEPANMTHSHGYTSTMRGYQLAAIFTGERSFNEKPELRLLDFMILPGMSPAVFPTAKRKIGGLHHCAVSPRIFRSTTYRSFFVKTITNNITKVPQTTNRKAENETFNRM